MANDKKADPLLLESEVMELVGASKTKITTLVEELKELRKGNEELATIIARVEGEKAKSEAILEERNSQLAEEKDENAVLNQLKEQRHQELADKRDQLAKLIETMEKEHGDLRSQSRKLAEDERTLKETRTRESAAYVQQQTATRKQIARLTEALQRKELEFAQLQKEWQYTTNKEKARIAALAAEKKKLLTFMAAA